MVIFLTRRVHQCQQRKITFFHLQDF